MRTDMRGQLGGFLIAGTIGFLVDAGVLYLALAAGLGYFAGRAVSFLCAVWVTWQLNRRFAFRRSRSESAWREWWRYLVAMSAGGLVNYAAYSATVLLFEGMPLLALVAVATGSIAGMVVNFASAKLWVFRRR